MNLGQTNTVQAQTDIRTFTKPVAFVGGIAAIAYGVYSTAKSKKKRPDQKAIIALSAGAIGLLYSARSDLFHPQRGNT